MCAGKTFQRDQRNALLSFETDPAVVMLVITLLAYGCPVQAIVAGFGFDRRTVKQWWQRAGRHCEAFHQQFVAGTTRFAARTSGRIRSKCGVGHSGWD